jgi:hypothetical protein
LLTSIGLARGQVRLCGVASFFIADVAFEKPV